MADVAVAAVIRKLVDITGNLIIDEASRLYWLSEDMHWLQTQLKHMQAYAAVAEARLITNPQVQNLVDDVRDLALDTDDILDTFIPKIESHRSRAIIVRTACLLPYSFTCTNFAREIAKIRKRVEAIDATRKSYGIPDVVVGADTVMADPRIVALHYDEPVVVGLNKDIAELKRKLLVEDEQLSFVSIVGMPGIGKTTLAKKVFKSVKDQFKCCAAITVSQQPNLDDLLEDIAEQVGLPEENRKRNLQGKLYAFLEDKCYLLLLDDIWRTEAWDRLRTCLPVDCMNGSRIIVTSRYTDVGKYIGNERSLHHLHPLDFLTSWNLFKKLIVPSLMIGDDQGFEQSSLGDIGKEIVKRCGGVPLAIVVAAGLLRERGPNEFSWNEVLKGIRHDAKDKCSQILAMSYRDLPSSLKPCFLYLGIFPEDYEMRVSELIRLWMAEKFIECCTGFELEDVGEDYVGKLVLRNLVQVVSRRYDGRIKSIRIHDLLHSLCTNISKEINFFHAISDDPNPLGIPRSIRFSIIRSTNLEIAKNKRISRVRTLLFFNSRQEAPRMSSKRDLSSRKLQVLSMNYSSEQVSHVFNIKKLSHLSYIKNFSRGLSSIENIKNLQSLDLRGIRKTTRIPMVVWTMKELRHLLMNRFVRIGSQRMIISGLDQVSLQNLQTLDGVFADNIDFAGKNTFPNLRKLQLLGTTVDTIKQLSGPEPLSAKLETLSLDGSINREPLNLSQYQKLMKLKAKFWAEQLPQSNQFPPNLLKLVLIENFIEEDPMQVLKELPKLKMLVLGLKSYTGSSLDCSGHDSFPQLQILHLSGLYGLEEMIGGEERGMRKLRELKIDTCHNLKTIPEWLQQLQTTN